MTHPVTMADVERLVNNSIRIGITSNNRIRSTVTKLIWFMIAQLALSAVFMALLLGNQQQTYKQLHANVDTYKRTAEQACVDIKAEMRESTYRILSTMGRGSDTNP